MCLVGKATWCISSSAGVPAFPYMLKADSYAGTEVVISGLLHL